MWLRESALLAALLWVEVATAGELWLVELEGDDGLTLEMMGARVERGSAPVWRAGRLDGEPLRPGDRLALWVEQGVALRIEVQEHPAPIRDPWRRGQDRVASLEGNELTLAHLGRVTWDERVTWVNGSAADLAPGRELVLTRDGAGALIEILIVNPEE
ncbi:hypothetical protein ACL00X_05375 [Aeromonas diversa]|uniref:hypothetical protein n=1 Tax=Aeromonas diversa TaxID=502790 RepID=UPI00399FC6A9